MKLIARLICWWRGKHDYGRARDPKGPEAVAGFILGVTRVKQCARCGHVEAVRPRKRKGSTS